MFLLYSSLGPVPSYSISFLLCLRSSCAEHLPQRLAANNQLVVQSLNQTSKTSYLSNLDGTFPTGITRNAVEIAKVTGPVCYQYCKLENKFRRLTIVMQTKCIYFV